MKVVEIPYGAIGIDCLSPLNEDVARAILGYTLPGTRTGFTFFERYLQNTTPSELAMLLSLDPGKVGVAFVSEARVSGWNQTTGGSDGLRAVTLARGLSLPTGQPLRLHLGCDLEGMAGVSVTDALDYGHEWCSAPLAAGFAGLGYIGFNVPLSPAGLYSLPFTGYWRGLSNEQAVATSDYMLWQGYPTQTLILPTGPWQADVDFVTRDKKGRLPTMVIAG
jgi:hypothetical protein